MISAGFQVTRPDEDEEGEGEYSSLQAMSAPDDRIQRALDGLLSPEELEALKADVVKVRGVGSKDEGDYFVEAVKHSINQADHRMSLEMRRNAFGLRSSSGAGAGIN